MTCVIGWVGRVTLPRYPDFNFEHIQQHCIIPSGRVVHEKWVSLKHMKLRYKIWIACGEIFEAQIIRGDKRDMFILKIANIIGLLNCLFIYFFEKGAHVCLESILLKAVVNTHHAAVARADNRS